MVSGFTLLIISLFLCLEREGGSEGEEGRHEAEGHKSFYLAGVLCGPLVWAVPGCWLFCRSLFFLTYIYSDVVPCSPDNFSKPAAPSPVLSPCLAVESYSGPALHFKFCRLWLFQLWSRDRQHHHHTEPVRNAEPQAPSSTD